jgi:D-lactate dehydrogenase (quinone)
VRDNILALEFVSGEGKIITSGKAVTKLSAGYDLARLLIGSEGTLGIITRATLKLSPRPKTHTTARVLYADAVTAAEGVVALLRLNQLPAAIELLDANALDLVRDAVRDIGNAGAMLLLELDDEDRERQIDAVRHTVAHALGFDVANTTEERNRLWQARKELSPRMREIAPKKINEDVVVPVSRIPALLAAIDELKHHYHLTILSFGHAGNGNLHVNMLINPDDPQESQRAEQCLADLFATVHQLGGSISGEHGIGMVKRPFMEQEHDDATRELFQRVKQAFDPKGVLNPDKMI